MYDLTKIAVVANNLSGFEKDCAITVALKITDDSCKMDEYEKNVFMLLYDALLSYESNFFERSVFDIIFLGRNNPSAQTYAQIKKLRESAMDMITRPKMKEFKANIRKELQG